MRLFRDMMRKVYVSSSKKKSKAIKLHGRKMPYKKTTEPM